MRYWWLIRNPKWAWVIFIGFWIFTIVIYIFAKEHGLSSLTNEYVEHGLAWLIYDYIKAWATPLSMFFLLVVAYLAYISIAENERIRQEDRALNIKSKALDEIREWTKELIGAVALASTTLTESKESAVVFDRFSELLKGEMSMRSLAGIFGGMLEDKVILLLKCYDKIEGILTSTPFGMGNPMLRADTKENELLIKRCYGTGYELLRIVTRTKVQLFVQDKAVPKDK